MTIDQIIKQRRSTYPVSFNGELIDDDVVRSLLENANWAPTHHYTEPWRFIVFKGGGLRRLIDEMIDIYRKRTPADKFNEKKVERMRGYPEVVSHIITIVMKRDDKGRIPEMEELASTACAVQNLWLSLDANGVAGYWSTGGGTYTRQMHEFLGLDDDDKLMGFFYLGKTEQRKPRGRRKPVEDKVTWIRE